ncbi:hypothetical protein WL93_00865 [Burkholderia diffusa]|nr:hypothetical protein WI26_29315 [Burkholderia diffusa]KVC12486.1 hypothetical protein WI69_24805 [Burkholderia diffusa]KVG26513.1 hypothetical protein WJ30_27875 [Burkholderia diffusa]KVH44837.1 hypothetical protein WJ39_22210 [Burkholderia diffusa]KVN05925.1 hypothetical protein WJ62_07815 [Burkholderia diffusa]
MSVYASIAGQFDPSNGGRATPLSIRQAREDMNIKGTADQRTGSLGPVSAVSVRDPAAHASAPEAARRHPPPE